MSGVQLGTVGEWMGALATATVAWWGAIYLRRDHRASNARRVLVDRVAADDWTDSADTKTRIAIQNLTDEPIWKIVVVQTWLSGRPVHVHTDKVCFDVPEGRHMERIGLNKLDPGVRDGWVTFGAVKEHPEDDPPRFGAAWVYWTDGSRRRWVARPGEPPVTAAPGSESDLPCLPP